MSKAWRIALVGGQRRITNQPADNGEQPLERAPVYFRPVLGRRRIALVGGYRRIASRPAGNGKYPRRRAPVSHRSVSGQARRTLGTTAPPSARDSTTHSPGWSKAAPLPECRSDLAGTDDITALPCRRCKTPPRCAPSLRCARCARAPHFNACVGRALDIAALDDIPERDAMPKQQLALCLDGSGERSGAAAREGIALVRWNGCAHASRDHAPETVCGLP